MEVIASVNALEPEMQSMPDDGIRELARDFRLNISNGEPLDSLMPQVFAAGGEIFCSYRFNKHTIRRI